LDEGVLASRAGRMKTSAPALLR